MELLDFFSYASVVFILSLIFYVLRNLILLLPRAIYSLIKVNPLFIALFSFFTSFSFLFNISSLSR